MEEIFFNGFATLLFIAGIGAAAYLFSWGIKALQGTDKFGQLANMAASVVRSLEQEFSNEDGSYKKELAMVAMRKFAKWAGAKVSDQMLSMLIEAAVQIMNRELKPPVQHFAPFNDPWEDEG